MGNLMKLKVSPTNKILPMSTARKSLRSASVSRPTSPPYSPVEKRPSSLLEVPTSPLMDDKDQTEASNFGLIGAGGDLVLSDNYFTLTMICSHLPRPQIQERSRPSKRSLWPLIQPLLLLQR
ncbi:hypothetical protein ACJRO7_009144 [Eucalyptus globulus]|uniref:Uncharacterized protein n=1 Tax=Eucalyptus globulus TaxID=34317 RepID=A0ABD3ITB5_EUCGL